ncbi:cache domain-containing sensor histidine kinase [Amedibacillus sp. YH-ame10]
MIQKFRSFLRKRGIKSRMFFAFIVLPLGLMVLMFLLYYFTSLEIILSKNKESSQVTVTLTEENIRLNTTRMEEQVKAISQSSFIRDVLDNPDTNKVEFESFMKQNISLEEKEGYQVFDDKGTLVYRNSKEHPYALELLKDGLDNHETVWEYDEQSEKILLGSSIYRGHTLIGYFVCDVKQSSLSPTFSKLDNTYNTLIVLDKNDTYLFGSSIYDKISIDTKKDKITLNGKEFFVQSKVIDGMDWKVVHLVSSDYLLEEFHNFRNMIFIYGIILVIILEMIAAVVYRSIYDPLDNILKVMRSTDEGNLIGQDRVIDDGKDEIHEVATNFNELLDRIDELVNTIETEQEQKRETQFQLLQAQINPHFLFNTLNTLHFLAIMNDDKPVSEGISALAKLLRNTIVDSHDVVTVKEELENLKNYIIIQKLRFGDLFETVYNVDKDVMDCKILKFLLQPIVENSILHAFEEDKEHQILTIRVQKEGMYLKIEIGDNGKGFKKIEKETTNKNLSGIGIENIQGRIQLMYGAQYSMNIRSVVHQGTIVTLLLPYVKGDQHV